MLYIIKKKQIFMDKKEMIKELLSQVNMEEIMINTSKILLANMKIDFLDEKKNEEFVNKYAKFISSEIFNSENIKNQTIEIYDSVYNLEEIEYLHHFYTSEIGKRILYKTNICSEKLMILGTTSMTEKFDKIIDFIMDNLSVEEKTNIDVDKYKNEIYKEFLDSLGLQKN